MIWDSVGLRLRDQLVVSKSRVTPDIAQPTTITADISKKAIHVFWNPLFLLERTESRSLLRALE